MHWVQSLKGKGFKKREIVDEFKKWKLQHEPFEGVKGMPVMGVRVVRFPPEDKAIEVGYDKLDGGRASTEREREREGRHEERERERERDREKRHREERIREDRVREERREERIREEQRIEERDREERKRDDRILEERIREERLREERPREIKREERDLFAHGDLYRPGSKENSPAVPLRPRKHGRGIDQYDNPPPKNYVCNRCRRKGMSSLE